MSQKRGSVGLVRRVVAASCVVLLMVAAPAAASTNKTRVRFRDGQIIVTMADVGNQAFTYQWVENDPRRHADDGLTLYYRIDQTELPPDVSWTDTEAAIESAVATFERVTCGGNLDLVRVGTDPGEDLGYAQHATGYGGSETPVADITFAGWVPSGFFEQTRVAPANGVSLPFVWDANDASLVWGVDVLDPTRSFSDTNGDGKHDMFATEIYFNADSNYVVDNDELGNTLYFIDVESIVLHELGHALGMDHFGRATLTLDEQGGFVDLELNRHSLNLMNTNNFYVKQDLSGSDVASFCGLYANWGKEPAGSG